MPEIKNINVSKKILADISSGIYRTPANALKEVVSNAFDAGANKVYISTNVPYFDVFTCEDDGMGMTARDFEKIMERIGSSGKRAMKKSGQSNGRPIIGKIGIGLLAVAQICNRFTVISKKKGSKKYFEATIDLKQFDEVEHEMSYKSGKGDISLGKYEIEKNLTDEIGGNRQYTKIIMEDLKKGFSEKLIESNRKKVLKLKEKAEKCESFEEFVQNVKKERFSELSQYDQLIWEIAMLCPVEYVDSGPLPKNYVLRNDIKRLRDYNFKVFVDGFEIRKPIVFPTDNVLDVEGVDYKIYPRLRYNKKINGTKLSFGGYLFHQRTRILPAELQGILIRIKDVAIGNYDRTFMHYPKAEGPMFGGVSGEIFVDEGLEEALNIDRNSFNETHEHYLLLQAYLQEYLGGSNGVFKDIRKLSKNRKDREKELKSNEELKNVRNILRELFGVHLKFSRRKSPNEKPYVYNRKEGKVIFHANPFWARSKKKRIEQEKFVLGMIGAKENARTMKEFEDNLLEVFKCMR